MRDHCKPHISALSIASAIAAAEAGCASSEADDDKKLCTVTDEGRAYLADNPDFVDAVCERLAAFCGKAARWRRWHEDDDAGGPRMSRLVDAAIENCLIDAAIANLHAVAAVRFRNDAQAEERIVSALAPAATNLRGR